MKKVLVLGLGTVSTGDITIAAEILRHSYETKTIELLFLCHPEKATYMESLGFPVKSLSSTEPEKNKKEFERLLLDWNPNMLLCADIYTMDYSKKWSGISFTYLKGLNLPLGSIDPYEWESTSFSWDWLGHPPSIRDAALIKDCDFIIRPCPVNKPRPNDKRIGSCVLFSSLLQASTITNTEWREELGIPKEHKVIFTINSFWEYIPVSYLSRVKNLINWMPRILHEYFAEPNIPLTIVHVGPYKWDFSIKKHLQYIYFNNMRKKASLFLDTIFYADLFCCTNAISTTLSTAVYYQTPPIVFQNLKRFDCSILKNVLPHMPQWYQEMAAEVKMVEAFRMFPWGWYRFLTPLFKNNPYADCFITAPVMEYKKVRKIIQQYLTDQKSLQQLKEKQAQYFTQIKTLEPVETFLDTIG